MSNTGMSQSTSRYKDTIEALKVIISESLNYPDKREVFVKEGSIELIFGLCDIRSIPWDLAVYCAAVLRILAHGNSEVKAKIIECHGVTPLLELCGPSELQSDEIGSSAHKQWRFRAHEQAAAVLHSLSFENLACQAEMVTSGIIKHMVQLCDVFNPNGPHSSCCLSTYSCSREANELLHELTFRKKLVGKIKEMSPTALREKGVNLIRSGLVNGFTEVSKIYSVDLFDTTVDYQDIKISDELIRSQLMWPDMSHSDTNNARDQGKYVKEKDLDKWADVCVTEVIDACHFWAHIGGKQVAEKVEWINQRLLSKECSPLTGIPEPGTFVCVSENIGGHRDCYRAQVLGIEHVTDGTLLAHVFAVDNGFTKKLSVNDLYFLCEDLLDIPPQAVLCCLPGVQVPSESAEVLEHVAGVLRNLTQENDSYRLYVAAQNGLEFLVKLCMIPNREVCMQAVGAILNLAINTKIGVRIGFLGGIQVLLDVCQLFLHDEDILLLALGGIQNLVLSSKESYVNRCRLADSGGLVILSQIYDISASETIKARCLQAIKNLFGSSITSLNNGKLEINKSPSQACVDIRSILDEDKKFSLAVSEDKPSSQRRRRRRRLRCGEVEAKPTFVALSPGSGKKSSTGESDGLSDYENSTSYEDTDGDTDGERLVTEKLGLITGRSDDTDVDHEEYYVQGYHVPFCEDDLHDFRPQTNVRNLSSRAVSRSLCAFLNSGKCGTVYLGVRHDGIVAGLKINKKERDQLRLGIDDTMYRFNPSVKHQIYDVHFIPVVKRAGSESPKSRMQVDDRYVVEIRIVNCTGKVYADPSGKCFYRQKSRNEEFTTQEVREKTIRELESVYNSEMNSMRKELEEMRIQLHEKSRSVSKEAAVLSPHNSVTSSPHEKKTFKIDVDGHRLKVSAEPVGPASFGSMKDSQADELKASNCVIS